jgi:N utilization substance protein A
MEQIDLKTLSLAILQIGEEKGISREKVVEVIEMALAAAYKKEYGKKEEKYRVKFDQDSGKANFYLVKKVINEDMLLAEDEEVPEIEEGDEEARKVKFNEDRHIMLEEAKKIKKDAEPGEELEFLLKKPDKFGRIAAQTAKQVLLQRIREAEREAVLSEFVTKQGEVISGIVQRKEGDKIFIDIGKTIAFLPKEEQIPGEFYKIGSRMRFYCLSVKESPKGPEVIVSRAHPKFLSKLFDIEVPEISSGVVEIKAVAREAGSRSKIAVAATEAGIDPVGSCVGQRGTRVNAVMQELGREKIDIVPWDEKVERFIENSLSPAKIITVKIKKNTAQVQVPQDQISLAIGRDGQNVRLASELTGWKIDVQAVEEEKPEERPV